MPSVLTLPVMVPSSATRKVPLPFACVLTGGTSSAPVRLTFIAPLPGIQAGILSRIPAQPASAMIANAAIHRFMFPPSSWLNPPQNETIRTLKYSHASHRILQRACAPAHSRLFARAGGSRLREAVRRLRCRRDQDRIAARRRSERKHGWSARRPRHAEPASQQARDDAQPEAARRAGRADAAGEDSGRGGGELSAGCEAPARYRLRVAREDQSARHP